MMFDLECEEIKVIKSCCGPGTLMALGSQGRAGDRRCHHRVTKLWPQGMQDKERGLKWAGTLNPRAPV